MNQEGLTPDAVTYGMLAAGMALGALDLSLEEQLHDDIEERGMQADGRVGAALVQQHLQAFEH